LAEAQRTADMANAADRAGDERCVDLYAWAALQTWPHLVCYPPGDASLAASDTASQLYHDCLRKLIRSGLRYQRLDPQRGLVIQAPDGRTGQIRIVHNGFPWQPEDFNELELIRRLPTDEVTNYWEQEGLGIPMVVLRSRAQDDRYLAKTIPFSATAVLRPATAPPALAAIEGGTGTFTSSASPAVLGDLEFHDPLRVPHIDLGTHERPLARDLSAPLVLALRDVDRTNLVNFLRPGSQGIRNGLRMIEPFQPGRIPVVLVHGLLSDKFTWVHLVNDLRSAAWFNRRFQIWTFQYSTGRPFLRSAAKLRRELRETVARFDPNNHDRALDEIILIGHSMGGLVSKLQVTQSSTILWDHVATRPFSQLRASPATVEEIRELFFFEPSSSVARVVFIGTPHQGSSWANSPLGRLGSGLVRMPTQQTSELYEIQVNNPGLLRPGLGNRLPTSVDLLQTGNPILVAMANLPVSQRVSLHSVIGDGFPLPDGSPGDGVVPVSSARHPGVVSERFIRVRHTEQTQHPETIAEVLRVLSEHLQQFDAVPSGTRL
jgi:pimeloyl-ACP methyl ester carboxylesterase